MLQFVAAVNDQAGFDIACKISEGENMPQKFALMRELDYMKHIAITKINVWNLINLRYDEQLTPMRLYLRCFKRHALYKAIRVNNSEQKQIQKQFSASIFSVLTIKKLRKLHEASRQLVLLDGLVTQQLREKVQGKREQIIPTRMENQRRIARRNRLLGEMQKIFDFIASWCE